MKKQFFSLALFAVAWLAGVTAQAHDGDHSYTNGICTIDGCTDKYQPATKTDGVYKLANVGNVEWMAAKVNAGATEPGDGGKAYAICSYELTADIDYDGLGTNAHTPIGTYDKKFCGVFDGKGHTILNMKLNQPDRPKPGEDGIGFFGCVRVGNDVNKNAIIHNLTIGDGCEVQGSSAYVGGILGRIHQRNSGNTLLIENCVNKATVSTSANHVAGIVGQITSIGGATVTIQNCTNKGTITTTAGYAAGILAQINDAGSATVNVKGCINEGAVTCSGLCAAGIVSQANNCTVALNIESCMNLAEVKSTGNKNCGGIFGANTSSKSTIHIVNCGNTGNVTGTSESAALTGWIGSNKGQVITNCWNSGTLSGKDGTKSMYRDDKSATEVTNIYDKNGGQGTVITDEMIASGELCYLLNGSQSTTVNWYQKLLEDDMPMPFAKEGAIVYLAVDQNCDGSLKGEATYSNNEGGSRDPHNFVNGICSVCGATDDTYVTLNDDGYYHLSNAYEVEWFSVKVKEAKNAQIKAKLDNDIDFTGITHTPIGPNSGAKFFGEFDGQGHTISNLTMNSDDNAAFFLWVRGGSTIKNLIMDSSCSFHATNRCAAFICVIQAAAGGTINLEKCINKANVSSENKVSAGFIAACNWENSDQPKVHFTNCWNAGNITQNGSDYAAAFFGWNKVGSPDPCMLTGCLNTGIISSVQNNQNLIRSENGNAQTINNCYDATPAGTQGVKTDWTTENPMTSGELCYYLNGDQSNIGWKQTIGTDAMPVLFGSSQQVYVQGNVNCLNNPVGNVTYVNTNGNTNYLGHNFNAESGMCDYCGTPDTNFKTLINGAYELGNHYDLTWFAAMVNTGNPTINGRLTADIDMSEVTYTPIGNNDNKYHGTFDGNGHKVKLNIDANAYGQGFISIATGGTTVKNLVVTGKVKNAGSKTAGIIAEAIGGGTITIQNCGNEATIEGAGGEVAAIVANNWGYQCTLNLENVYNIGDVSGTGDVSTICACQGNSSSVFKNVYNAGSVTGAAGGNFVRTSMGTYTNCYSTTLSDNDNASIISTDASKVASGELCAKLGFGFRQNLSSDTYPNFASDHGFVAQIGAAGYSTMYNVYSDVTIPSGIEAYAGVVNGESLSLVAIENKIAASEPVILKLKDGTDAGIFNFMPTTGATSAASNSLKGSDGNVTSNGSTIFALSNKANGVGFYPVGDGVKIPAGKAYLEYTGSSPVKGFTFVFDEDDATGISLMEDGRSQMEGAAIYNIAGQRISKMQKGINIVNGKKILK